MQGTPIIRTRQKLLKKKTNKQTNKVGPSSTHPLSLSRMQSSTSEKIKEIHAVNSYKNNSPNNYSKIKVGPSSTHAPSLSHVQTSTSEKKQRNSCSDFYHNNWPKIYSKNKVGSSSTHPPTHRV